MFKLQKIIFLIIFIRILIPDILFSREVTANYPTNLFLINHTRTFTSIGGSGQPEEKHPFTAIGIGVFAGGLILISNDFYIYPTYSYIKGFHEINDYVKGLGFVFGLRKTFRHSALEYGMSITTFSDRYYMTDGTNTWPQYYADKKTGLHINYVHQIFYNKTPSWQKIYLGPTINMVNDFGYGGIIGTELRFADRFKFDVRYEYSSQTNQLQAGIILNFQKEYFWRKH